VSTSTCSPLVDKPQLPDRVGGKLWPATWQQEKPVLFDEIIRHHTLDAYRNPIKGDFHFPRGNPCLLAERLWDHQASSLIYGSAHTITLPIELVPRAARDSRNNGSGLAGVAQVDARVETLEPTEAFFHTLGVDEANLAIAVAGGHIDVGDFQLEVGIGRLRDDAVDEFGGDALAPVGPGSAQSSCGDSTVDMSR
jgi:hypothetical protein